MTSAPTPALFPLAALLPLRAPFACKQDDAISTSRRLYFDDADAALRAMAPRLLRSMTTKNTLMATNAGLYRTKIRRAGSAAKCIVAPLPSVTRIS